MNRPFITATLTVFVALVGFAACEGDVTQPAAERFSGPVTVRTYRDGSRIFLEVVAGSDSSRIGLEEKWGAAIVEASLNGTNFVNAFDAGREIQMSLYDGNHQYDTCAGCRGAWGWNPVQAGDRLGNGSTVLESRLEDDRLVVRVRPNHWYPDNKGGGWGQPVGADVVITQIISPIPGHPRAFRVQYTIDHQGDDTHALTGQQEFPAIYVNREFARFVHYDGSRPWTNSPTRVTQLTPLFSQPARRIHSSEGWGAFANQEFLGITVYTPGSFPYFTSGYQEGKGGPSGSGSNYTHPYTPFGLQPRSSLTGDVYLILGDVHSNRQAVYDIRRTTEVRDIATPLGDLSVSHEVAMVGTDVLVSGWSYDNVGVKTTEIFVNDSLVGPATFGKRRTDVRQQWPGAPLNSGFEYRLKTKDLHTGPQTIRVRWTDGAGNRLERTATFRLWN